MRVWTGKGKKIAIMKEKAVVSGLYFGEQKTFLGWQKLKSIILGKKNSMRAIWTILLLVLSNSFMTLAWYGHLKFREMKWFENLGLIAVVLISWGIALFEYFFQVPANRIGYKENGGPFSLVQLKVIQEVITLVIFSGFLLLVFKNETLKMNHLIGFA